MFWNNYRIGALDGKTFSNSWFFEYALQWTAILIKPQPNNYKKLQLNRPNAIKLTTICGNMNGTMNFRSRPGAIGGLVDSMSKRHMLIFHLERAELIAVSCTPLANVLKKLRVNRIDIFFSDVEGADLEVLRTMDWNIPVLLWVVELDRNDPVMDNEARYLLIKNGYCKMDWDVNTYCKGCVK